MFERFTDRARRVIVLAQEDARQLGHNYIGTEHILLGLANEGEGVAAQVLRSFGVDLDELRDGVVEIIGHGKSEPTGHIPFTPRAKKVLDLSLREALQLGHRYIGTEHILLGVVRESDGVGAQVLERRGIELNDLRNRIIEQLTTVPPAPEPAVPTAQSRMVIRSLTEENRLLRREVDRLRDFITRHLGESPPPAIELADQNPDEQPPTSSTDHG
ncbi:hypothetical protein IU452_28875 [Nocardia transvalensis]|nr:hypothetical protein [Nocardia transvalensis]